MYACRVRLIITLIFFFFLFMIDTLGNWNGTQSERYYGLLHWMRMEYLWTVFTNEIILFSVSHYRMLFSSDQLQHCICRIGGWVLSFPIDIIRCIIIWFLYFTWTINFCIRSISLWDLKENEIWHHKVINNVNGNDWIIRIPTYTTTGSPEVSTHNSKIVAIRTLSKTEKVYTETSKNKFIPIQVVG